MATQTHVNILTVSQLTRRVKNLLEEGIGTVWVSGEISNFKRSSAGHCYFSLKDAASQVDCVMFRGRISKLQFTPDNGLEVILHGQVSVYERRGNYQIICEEMHPKGQGALQLAFEQLRARLEAEGLFDEALKKPLPMLPKRIGIVTSATGAAIRDILNVINRRFANVHILLYPTRVQGEEAAGEITAGIEALDQLGIDVLIVGRGGGSLEDLWPFNEEAVVRAIHKARTPVISAVGHEVDVTLSDYVADMRAPTPSAAAELVVQEQQALADRVRNLERALAKGLTRRLESAQQRLRLAGNSYVFRRPEKELLRQRRQAADEARMRLDDAMNAMLREWALRVQGARRSLALLSPGNQVRRAREQWRTLSRRLLAVGSAALREKRNQLSPLAAQLDAFSPLKILSRGYSLTWKHPGGALVRDAGELQKGDQVCTRFGQGRIIATVDDVEKEDDERI